MADLVLLTGISGFVGGHVGLALLNAGYRVRGSVRSLDKAAKVRSALAMAGADISRLEFVELDLLSDAGWTDAMAGVRYLQHTASPFIIEMPRDPQDLIRPATEGTRRALEAAFAADVERIVLTSSLAAVTYGHPRSRTAPYTAADWTNLETRGLSPYIESKTRAERLAWEIAGRHNRTSDLVSINPGTIFGPLLDDDPGTSVGLLKRMFDGSLPATARFYNLVVDIRDVAEAHLAAMRAPDAGGRRFPMSAGTLSLMELAEIIRQGLPDRAGRLPRFEVPDWVVRLIAPFDASIKANIGELNVYRTADAAEAVALLGHPLISAEDTTLAAARSLIAQRLA